MDELHVEGQPQDDQKERLENFLSELMLISRRYRILLRDNDECTQLLDMNTGNLIGLGLAWFTGEDPHHILSYVPVDSILDGTWLVEGPDGPIEQRTLQNVFPRRPG